MRAVTPHPLCGGRGPARHRVLDRRLHHSRVSCRRNQPQAGGDALLRDVPDPDPVVYLRTQSLRALLVAVAVFGFFSVGIWAWAPIWLPELFPTRMRGTAVAFCYNAPRWISCTGPLIAGTLIVALGGYGPAATLVALCFIVGFVASLFCARDQGQAVARRGIGAV
jgi:MFS family permease